jgi:FKBP-type peptidyl-prolyl cis-trans isomerase 2
MKPTKPLTTEDLMLALEETIEQMSAKEKAQVRVQLREAFGLPAVPEPDFWVN